ncbi:DUF3080 family protein, partial [Vibrio parahaemolyticus]|nr:DUF3080 family protein [Vibrio parahaemolyticus]
MRSILLFLILILNGCDNWFNPENAMFDKYHQRVANVLDVPAIPIELQSTVTIPAKRVLFEPLPRLSIGLLESYQLR